MKRYVKIAAVVAIVVVVSVTVFILFLAKGLNETGDFKL